MRSSAWNSRGLTHVEAAWCGGKLGIQADGGVASSLDLTTKLATGILCFSWSLLPHAKQDDSSPSRACDDPVQQNSKYPRALNKLHVLCKCQLLRCGSRLEIWMGMELLLRIWNSLCAPLPRMIGINRNLLAEETGYHY